MRTLARRFDDAFRPSGLTSGQFSLMMSLNRPQPAAVAIAALLAMNRTTLTAALKPSQRRHLVRIALDRADRRARLMTLMREGRQLLARAVPVWKRTHGDVETLLDIGEPDLLRNDLRKLS